jgi:nucleoid-associated protein YgaU
MQRDLKIGISLCFLMFGVVGALMFRREQPTVKAQGLQVKTARQLDQKIAQRGHMPYMTGEIESDEAEEAEALKKKQGAHSVHLQPTLHAEGEDDLVAPPLAGIGQQGTKRTIGADSRRPRDAMAPRVVAENIIAGPQTHTIQSGDTLSSLAEKYLGSQKRFQEIFDANRNLLTSPNRLPEGVVITIPSLAKEVRRISDQPSIGTQISQPGRHGSRELTDIRPIAPGEESGQSNSVPTSGTPEIEANTPLNTVANSGDIGAVSQKPDESQAGETKTGETTKKRSFSAGRLPFGKSISPRTNSTRKALDLEVEATPRVREQGGFDPAHDSARQVYQVRRGDSLERISQKVYGTPKRAAEIFNANRDKLASPDAVKEGLELNLP